MTKRMNLIISFNFKLYPHMHENLLIFQKVPPIYDPFPIGYHLSVRTICISKIYI